jgi:3-oxoacyl-[acyl-carrier protein] reductase
MGNVEVIHARNSAAGSSVLGFSIANFSRSLGVNPNFAAKPPQFLKHEVNCVGSLLLKPAHLTKESEWHHTIATNLTSAFATVQAAAKTMGNRGGSVVLMSTAAARLGLANHEAIAAAKAGVEGLAQSAAASYAKQAIRFNVVAPGLVKTKLTKRIWESERAATTSIAMHALGRLGEAEEVASLITWLLEPANSWVTGEVFAIDGGLAHIRSSH